MHVRMYACMHVGMHARTDGRTGGRMDCVMDGNLKFVGKIACQIAVKDYMQVNVPVALC